MADANSSSTCTTGICSSCLETDECYLQPCCTNATDELIGVDTSNMSSTHPPTTIPPETPSLPLNTTLPGTNSTTIPISGGSDDLTAGEIAGIVICVIFVILLCIFVIYLIMRKFKQRRRLHGKYNPAAEEIKSATEKGIYNIPIPGGPGIEGLI